MGVNVPSLYYVEVAAGCLYLERVQGGALKDALFGRALSEEGEPPSLPAQAAPVWTCCGWLPCTLIGTLLPSPNALLMTIACGVPTRDPMTPLVWCSCCQVGLC